MNIMNIPLGVLRLILFNILFLCWLRICYRFPEYRWSIEIVFNIMLIISIIIYIYFIINIEKLFKSMKINYDTFEYNVLHHNFNIIFIIVFVDLDYNKSTLFLYIINILFVVTLKFKYMISKNEIYKKRGV